MTLKNYPNDNTGSARFETATGTIGTRAEHSTAKQDVYSSNQKNLTASKNGAQTSSISKPSGQDTVKTRSKPKHSINPVEPNTPNKSRTHERTAQTIKLEASKSIEKNTKPQSTFQELARPDFQQLQNLKERFINRLMLKGQKALARNIFFKSLAALAELNTDKRVEKAGKKPTLKKSSLWSFSPVPLKRTAMVFTALKTTISTKAVINLRQTKSRINTAFHLPKNQSNTFTPQDDLFLRAIENVKPFIELKSKRVAGSTFKIPFQIQPSHRQYSLAVRWLILAARQRPERHMINKLAAELFDAANSRGHAIKNKIEMHRSAEANRAYLHFRW